jgi:hypothetical protein
MESPENITGQTANQQLDLKTHGCSKGMRVMRRGREGEHRGEGEGIREEEGNSRHFYLTMFEGTIGY